MRILLIDDDAVLKRNRDAYDELDGTKELEIIEEAGHLFEGPGELEKVADITTNWFDKHSYNST